MKRLIKKSKHDWYNRDLAIVYINGEVYEDAIHGICLQRYLDDKKIDKTLELWTRPAMEQFKQISKMNNGQDVILAHRVDKVNSIYFIYGLRNGEMMADEQIIADLKEVYPDSKIINDLDHDDDDDHGYDSDKQIDKGRDRMLEFEMRKMQPYIDSGEFVKDEKHDDSMYNKYCYVQCDLDNQEFRVITCLDIGYSYYDLYSINKFDEILKDIKDNLNPIINEIEKIGFVFYEEQLAENREFIFIKDDGEQRINLIGGSDTKEFIFDYDYVNDELENKLNEIGVECGEYITLDQIKELAKIL